MKKIPIMVIAFLAGISALFAQTNDKQIRQCGSDAMIQLSEQLDPGLLKRIQKMQELHPPQPSGKYGGMNTTNSTPSFVIPVVFHIIKDGGTTDQVPDYDQVLWQLATLNANFSNNLNSVNNVPTGPHAVNTNIQFCLAKKMQVGGVPSPWPNATPGMMTYVSTNPSINDVITDFPSTSLSDIATLTNYANAFPPDMYLNVFCVTSILQTGASLAGIAVYPWMSTLPGMPIDGIVMLNNVTGNNYYGLFNNSMNQNQGSGTVLAHEAGHYLGLAHTFDRYQPDTPTGYVLATNPVPCYGETNPYTGGDFVYDTPPTKFIGSSLIPVNTCNENYYPYGPGGNADENDQLENLMSYSNDYDKNTFTQNQSERMWAALDNTYSAPLLLAERNNLWQPANLIATGVTAAPACGPGILTAVFMASPDMASSTCNTVPFNFHTPTLPGYFNATSFAWNFGDGGTSTLPNPMHLYTIFPTTYVVTLTASDGISTVTHNMTIEVPETYPRIVGQSGDGIEVCRGTEQTILIKFPPDVEQATLTDGTTTYIVNNNRKHWCTGPYGVYVMPFTFPVNASGTWHLDPAFCANFDTGTATFEVRECCPNLVDNGDIEAGSTSFYSDYVFSPSYIPTGAGFAFAGLGGGTSGELYFDSDLYTTFSLPGCTSPGAQKLLAGQSITGFIAGEEYYVSFKTNQGQDSLFCGPKKFRIKLFNGTTSIVLDANRIPSAYPPVNCSSPKSPGVYQVFNFKVTMPAGITASTPYALELYEIDHSGPDYFEYIIDDITVRRLLPLITPPVPVLSAVGPSPLCYPATFVVSASGAIPVTWQPGGFTSQSFMVTPSSGEEIIYTASFDNGYCIITNNISVTQPKILDLVVKTPMYCTNAELNTVVTAEIFPTGTTATFVWEPGGLVGPVHTVNPSTTTTYIVTATTTEGCTIEVQKQLTVSSHCCPDSYTAPELSGNLSGGTLNGPMVILNDITINPSSGLTKFIGEFAIAEGVKITVTPGNELWLNQAHLYACGLNMWQGIVLEDGSQVSSNANTLIEDAITAIDATNISSSHHGYVVEVSQTTFNKNYVGIKLSNSVGGLTDLQTFVVGDVFTSRDLPFTSTTWPGAGLALGDLRYASGPLTGITTPYLLNGYASANLKQPYTNQPGHIGISIEEIGNSPSYSPGSGIIIGHTNVANGFNLFDNIGTGINVENASMTTFNNVFQGMRRYSTSAGLYGGTGIKHNISSLMNANLFISPPAGHPAFKNYFWNCYVGVDATNVYNLSAENLVVRSSHHVADYIGGVFSPGNNGVQVSTNRFNFYDINSGDFNNISDGINVTLTSGNYDVGSGVQTGAVAGDFNINQNYFGAYLNSSTPLAGPEYMHSAITVNSPAMTGFVANGFMSIESNRIDRAFNGISVDGLNALKLTVNGNLIYLHEDAVTQPQHGIRLANTVDQVVSGKNEISSVNFNNSQIAGFYVDNNAGTQSPYIVCNTAYNIYTGFSFNNLNKATVWMGNVMTDYFYGMLLDNNAIIGQQGSSGTPGNNQWYGAGSLSGFDTYVGAGCSAGASPLWLDSSYPFNPAANGSSSPAQDYASTGNLFYTGGSVNYNCPSVQQAPNYRPANSNELTGIAENNQANNYGLSIFPNPAADHVIVKSVKETDALTVRIMDITGKIVMFKKLQLTGGSATVDLDLEQGVYMIEIINNLDQKMISKLVIVK